jgi:hypothetical protein
MYKGRGILDCTHDLLCLRDIPPTALNPFFEELRHTVDVWEMNREQ